jgi:hypothetical protein
VRLVLLFRRGGVRLMPPADPDRVPAVEAPAEEPRPRRPSERAASVKVSDEVYDMFRRRVEERYGRRGMHGYVLERLMQKYADGEVDIGI